MKHSLQYGLLGLINAFLMGVSPVSAQIPSDHAVARQWLAAKLVGRTEPLAAPGWLEVTMKSGRLLKNMATTKVYHLEVGALPLRVDDQEFRRGLYCPSVGKIMVHLPGSAKRFDAVFGVDSNRVTSFYSNAGRGRVVGTVEIDGRELYRSPVMKEGMAGVPVAVPLDGSTEFTLTLSDAGGGIVERVDFNQAD